MELSNPANSLKSLFSIRALNRGLLTQFFHGGETLFRGP